MSLGHANVGIEFNGLFAKFNRKRITKHFRIVFLLVTIGKKSAKFCIWNGCTINGLMLTKPLHYLRFNSFVVGII